MSARTFLRRHASVATHAWTVRTPHARESEANSDHDYVIKVIAAVLFVTVIVAVIAPFGWDVLPVAFAVLLATTAAVLHATVRLLNEISEEER